MAQLKDLLVNGSSRFIGDIYGNLRGNADTATKATNADTATNANHATSADTATKANTATKATSADSATTATTADKVKGTLTIKMGSTTITYNGSSAKTATITPSAIGAAASSHTHTKSQITDFAHNHDERYYTESEIDTKLSTLLGANNAMVFKGAINKDTDLPVKHSIGWTYWVNTAGTYASKTCEVGDLIICITAGDTANKDHWIVAQTNIVGAVTGPNTSTVNAVPTFTNATGKVIKDNPTVTIDDTGLFTAPYIAMGTDKTHYFQSRKFRGEGNADTYYHAIDFGYSGHNQVDFHEYGGIWNFYENTKGTAADGKLVASIKPDGFHGNLNGNATTATTATKAGSADKVNNNLVIQLNSGTTEGTNKFTYNGSAAKTVDITPAKIGAAPSTSQYEAYLQWGGKNLSSHYSPIDATLNGRLGANRLAGIKPAGVTIEYSNNGGSTWTNYELTNNEKVAIFTMLTCPKSLRIAGPTAAASANSKLRITLDGVDGSIYTQLNKLHIYISTDYSNNCTVSLESYDYNSSTEWHSVIKNQPITGWSGWNILNFTLPGSTAFGGTNQNIHQRKIRLTFSNASVTKGKENQGLRIYNIYGYGGMGWTTPSTLATSGVPYTYDSNLVVSFPNHIKSSLFVGNVEGDVTGNITGNAATASKWKNARTFKIGNCSRTVDGSSDITWPLSDIGAVNKAGDTMTGNLIVGSASIGTNGYIEGTWLKTTANISSDRAGNFAIVRDGGWIYSRTPAQARQDMGLSTAMHFIGKATVDITDGSTVDPKITGYTTKTAGDVIIDKSNSYEYVWTLEGKWERLGPDGSYSVIGHNHDDVYIKKVNFLGDGTDLNNTLDSGFYRLQTGTNFPPETSYGQLINSNGYKDGTNDTILQICGSFPNKDFYIRGASIPITTAWHRITLDDDLNNVYVRKSGDTITGELAFTNANAIRFVQGSGTTKSVLMRNDGNNFYIVPCNATSGNSWYIPDGGSDHSFRINLTNGFTYVSKLYGAVWNDYAEFRNGDTIEPGKCVIEVGDDTLITSTERLIPGANITSDTFGFAIGETKQAKTPIAVSGRVLAYPYESREEFKKNIGRPVCSGPNGTVSIMTDEEYRNKGYCAIGTISAVPDYEEWGTGKVKVNGRVWIKVF